MKRDTKGMEGKDSGLGLEISRRTLLRVLATSAVAGGALPLLESWGAAPSAKGSISPSGFTPKRGGILRYGLSTDPPHLDPHVDSGGAPGRDRMT